MKLSYLALENYRKFARIAIEFPDGVTGIIGPNGAGKTTLVEAIGWALYGQAAARTKKELIKRRGASSGEPCRVLLQFELNSDQYEVMREMVGKDLNPNAWVKVNSQLVVPPGANSAAESTSYLMQKIGMDRESFFTSLVAKQKELNALSDRTYGERRKLILRMLKIDALDQVITNIRSDKRDRRKAIEFIKPRLKPIEELKQRLKTLKDEEQAELKKKLVVEERIAKQASLVAELKQNRDEGQAKYEEFNNLCQAIGRFEEREASKKEEEISKNKELEELKATAIKLKEIQPKISEYKALENEKQKLEEQRESYYKTQQLEASKTRILEELEKLKERRKRMDKAKKGLELDFQRCCDLKQKGKEMLEKLSQAQNLINQKELKKEQLKKRIQEIERQKTFLKGPQSRCPTCKRPLGLSYYLVIEGYNEAIEENKKTCSSLEAELAKLKAQVALSEGEKKSTEEELTLFEKAPGKLEQLKEEIKNIEEQAKEMESKNAEISKAMAKVGEVEFEELKWKRVSEQLAALQLLHEQWIKLTNKVERIKVLEEELRKISEKLRELNKLIFQSKERLVKIGFDEATYKKIREAYDRSKDGLAELEREKATITQKILQLKNDKTKTQEEIGEQEKLLTQISELRREIRYLDRLAGDREEGLLNEFKSNLISRIGPALSSYASQLLSQLSGEKYSGLEVDENYEIHLIDQGESYALDRFSGGETDLANLCLRLAISQVIAERSGSIDFQFIILDEIFGSQDQERKGNILSTLNGLTQRFRQIFLITHVDEVKDAMEYVIMVKEREDGTSSVSLG
jgi:exonuclease SbcC